MEAVTASRPVVVSGAKSKVLWVVLVLGVVGGIGALVGLDLLSGQFSVRMPEVAEIGGPAAYVGLFLFTGLLLYGLAIEYLHSKTRSRKRGARAGFKLLKEPTAVLAGVVVCTVVALAVTKTPVPEPISQAFFAIVGFYFGRNTSGGSRPKRAFERSAGVSESQ